MRIRKAKSDDAEGIANVLMQSYNISSIKEGADAFRAELRKGCKYLVAEDKGMIIGIASWKMHGLPKHQLAELDRIAVLPECRGKGAAKRIFGRLLQDAQGFYKTKGQKLRKLFLQTHKSNARAQAFYNKLGFKHEATLKDHYYKGEDEMVFSMHLK